MAYTLKAAKTWFQTNPSCKVIYHWRFKEMPAASRENMELPRDVKVIGNRAVFGPHQSEMSLRTDDWTATVNEGGLLDIHNGDGRLVMTYAPAPKP